MTCSSVSLHEIIVISIRRTLLENIFDIDYSQTDKYIDKMTHTSTHPITHSAQKRAIILTPFVLTCRDHYKHVHQYFYVGTEVHANLKTNITTNSDTNASACTKIQITKLSAAKFLWTQIRIWNLILIRIIRDTRNVNNYRDDKSRTINQHWVQIKTTDQLSKQIRETWKYSK